MENLRISRLSRICKTPAIANSNALRATACPIASDPLTPFIPLSTNANAATIKASTVRTPTHFHRSFALTSVIRPNIYITPAKASNSTPKEATVDTLLSQGTSSKYLIMMVNSARITVIIISMAMIGPVLSPEQDLPKTYSIPVKRINIWVRTIPPCFKVSMSILPRSQIAATIVSNAIARPVK